MARYAEIIVLFISTIGILVKAQNVNLTISNSSVSLGESVSITCTVSQFNQLDLVSIFKHVDGAEGDVKLSINSALQTFPGQERYKVDSKELQPGWLYNLTIQNARAEDAGKFSCEFLAKGGATKVSQKVSLQVKVKPTMELSFVNGSRSRSVIFYPTGLTFRAGQAADFRCDVISGIPASLVTLRIGATDITNLAFHNQTQVHYSPNSTPKMKEAFKATYHSVVANLHRLEMKKEYANQRLVCEARNAAMDPISKHVMIKIQGVPAGSSSSHVAPGLLASICTLLFVFTI